MALTNECLGQADACFEGAVNVVAEVPPGDESLLTGHLCDLLSTLLVHPVRPPFRREMMRWMSYR